MAEWADNTVDANAELANIIWRTNATAHMAGQLFIRDIELSNTKLALAAEGGTAGTFFNLPFTEAIDSFADRELMDVAEFDELIQSQRAQAFAVRRALSERVRDSMFRSIGRALQPEGEGLRQFIANYRDGVSNIEGTTQSYLETVYRTNVATAYGAGRLRQQLDPDVLAAGLFWEYRTAGDNRVRDDHAALSGAVWRAGDDAALVVYPPNGFNCRCSVVVIEDVDPSRLQRSVTTSVVTDGFIGPPS